MALIFKMITLSFELSLLDSREMLESACTFLISVISQSCIFLVFTLLLYLLSPFIPNIGMHILPTVLYTFLKVLTRRLCLLIKSFFHW